MFARAKCSACGSRGRTEPFVNVGVKGIVRTKRLAWVARYIESRPPRCSPPARGHDRGSPHAATGAHSNLSEVRTACKMSRREVFLGLLTFGESSYLVRHFLASPGGKSGPFIEYAPIRQLGRVRTFDVHRSFQRGMMYPSQFSEGCERSVIDFF